MTRLESLLRKLQLQGDLSPQETITIYACVTSMNEHIIENMVIANKFAQEYGTFTLEGLSCLLDKG